MGGGDFLNYYNITIGGEGSTGTPNLYYVINGRPLNQNIKNVKMKRKNFCNLHVFSILLHILPFLSGVLLLHYKLSYLFCSSVADQHIFSHSGNFLFRNVHPIFIYLFSFMNFVYKALVWYYQISFVINISIWLIAYQSLGVWLERLTNHHAIKVTQL